MSKKTFGAAFLEGIAGVMREDPNLTLMGSGFLGHTQRDLDKALFDEFGRRIFEPPVSESAVASLGVGAALAGHRMLIHFGTAGFALEAWNQLVHEAGVARYMSGGQVTVPLTFHAHHGMRPAGAPQHSSSPQAMLANCPGIEIVLPSTPADVKGLIRTALLSDNPTFFFNHPRLLRIEGEVPDGNYAVPFGVADVKRPGRDVTIVATSHTVQEALAAADMLSKDGIEAEVVDPRTAVPLDVEGICASVRRTGRLVTVDETAQMCSIGSEIAAAVAEHAFDALRAPISRVARLPIPTPFSPPLEEAARPTAERIAAAARKTVSPR